MFQGCLGAAIDADAAESRGAVHKRGDGLAQFFFVINNGDRDHRIILVGSAQETMVGSGCLSHELWPGLVSESADQFVTPVNSSRQFFRNGLVKERPNR